jgi:phosphoribosylamine-glycine ligase
MKLFFVSATGDGAWAVWKLIHDGHDVTWTLGDTKYIQVLEGLIPPPVESVPDPSSYNLIVFDMSGHGDAADLAREHTPVIGASSFCDQLEHDRTFGIQFMEKCGIRVPEWQAFTDISDAVNWLRKTKKRTVFKPLGGRADSALTYVSKSADDMIRYLEVLFKKVKVKSFVLQEFINGTEISSEGYFNGTDFFALNHTLEEKKFLSGGIGPNTGCSGNLVWMPGRSDPVFERGLLRAKDALREAGFRGPIDLNTIVTEGEIYGLEWTPRFGYEGTCNLARLIPGDFATFLFDIATGQSPNVGTARANFCATIRITVPPYPRLADPKKDAGVPVVGIDIDNPDCWYLSDVHIKEGTESELETIGTDGLIGAPICIGDTIKQTFSECEQAIDKLLIPDLQWRDHVAECCERRYETLSRQGWLRRI